MGSLSDLPDGLLTRIGALIELSWRGFVHARIIPVEFSSIDNPVQVIDDAVSFPELALAGTKSTGSHGVEKFNP